MTVLLLRFKFRIFEDFFLDFFMASTNISFTDVKNHNNVLDNAGDFVMNEAFPDKNIYKKSQLRRFNHSMHMQNGFFSLLCAIKYLAYSSLV